MLANLPLRDRPALRALALLVVGGALVGAFTLWWFVFREAGPPPVDITGLSVNTTTSAAAQTAAPAATSVTVTPTPANPVSPTAGTTPAAPAATSGGTDAGVDGTWQVDTSIGSFSDFSNSFVGYRVREQLVSIGATTAVGRTPAVSGTLTIEGTTVTGVEIEADLTQLESDERNRDRQLARQAIETSQFPTSTFRLTQPIELGTIPPDDVAIQATAIGELTLHGVTNAVEISLEAKRSGDVIIVTGTLPIVFADYDIDKPTSFNVLTVEDNGIMELQLFFTRAS